MTGVRAQAFVQGYLYKTAAMPELQHFVPGAALGAGVVGGASAINGMGTPGNRRRAILMGLLVGAPLGAGTQLYSEGYFSKTPRPKPGPDTSPVGHSVSYDDALQKAYGPEKAQQYIADARRYQLQHPDIPWGVALRKVYDRVPVNIPRNIDDKAERSRVYNAFGDGEFTHVEPGATPRVYIRNGDTDSKNQNLLFQALTKNMATTRNGETRPVSKELSGMQAVYPGWKTGDAVASLSAVKNYARQLGYATRTPEEVDAFISHVQKHVNPQNQFIPGIQGDVLKSFQDAFEKATPPVALPKLYSPEMVPALRQLLPGFAHITPDSGTASA